MKIIHKFFSYFNVSLGGADACIKHDCKEYCGYSPSQFMIFHSKKHEQFMYNNAISKAGD